MSYLDLAYNISGHFFAISGQNCTVIICHVTKIQLYLLLAHYYYNVLISTVEILWRTLLFCVVRASDRGWLKWLETSLIRATVCHWCLCGEAKWSEAFWVWFESQVLPIWTQPGCWTAAACRPEVVGTVRLKPWTQLLTALCCCSRPSCQRTRWWRYRYDDPFGSLRCLKKVGL